MLIEDPKWKEKTCKQGNIKGWKITDPERRQHQEDIKKRPFRKEGCIGN